MNESNLVNKCATKKEKRTLKKTMSKLDYIEPVT